MRLRPLLVVASASLLALSSTAVLAQDAAAKTTATKPAKAEPAAKAAAAKPVAERSVQKALTPTAAPMSTPAEDRRMKSDCGHGKDSDA